MELWEQSFIILAGIFSFFPLCWLLIKYRHISEVDNYV